MARRIGSELQVLTPSPVVQLQFTARKSAHSSWSMFSLNVRGPGAELRRDQGTANPSGGAVRTSPGDRGQGPGLNTATPAAQYMAVPNEPAKLWAPAAPRTLYPVTTEAMVPVVVCCAWTV